MKQVAALCIFLWLLAQVAAPIAAEIIVDEVAPGSEIEKAGLRTGDVLHSWERLSSPPANPEPAQGVLASPFDWMWLEVEQAHRGPVVLYGERNGQRRTWHVVAGEWNVHFNSERRGRSRARPILTSQDVTLYERGQLRIRRRKLTEGIADWRRLAGQIPHQEDDPLRCWQLLRIGEALGEVGDWTGAHEAFHEAMSLARSDRTRVFLWEALGKGFEYEGRFREARESYRAGLAIRRSTEPDSLGVARSLHQIASQEWNLGNLDGAKEGFDQALALRTRWAPESFLEADSLHSQAYIALDRSDLEGAEYFLKRAVAIQERLDPNSFWMAFKLVGLGDVYALRGDLEVAAHHFERALEIRQRVVPGGESVATALIRLGRLKLDQGRWNEGRNLFEQALAILQRVFPRQPMVAAVLNDLGNAALAAGELDRAESSYRRALRLLADVAPERPWTAQSWNGLAEVESRRGNWKDALDHHQKALAIYRRVGSGTDGEARALAGLGRIVWRLGNLEQASGHLLGAIRALEAQVGRLGGSEDVKAEFRSLRRRIYFDAAAVELELGRNEQAFDIQEASRAQGFLSLLAARDLRVSDGVPAELEDERRRVGRRFRQALNTISDPQEKDAAKKAWRELPILREQLDSIAQEIRKLSPRPTALHFPQPMRAGEVARELDAGMKILAYQVGETATHVFVLSEDGRVAASRLLAGRADLQREVQRFRAATENRLFVGDRSALEPLRRLYRSVLQPVEPLLDGASRLLILPDGPLHAVPWAALVRELSSQDPTGRSWQFLVEWKPFSVALSATVWSELKRSRGRVAPGDRVLPIAAFGDPVLRPAPPDPEPLSLAGAVRRGLDLPPLPFSRHEVESIAQLFPGQVAAFLGPEATEERAKSLPRGTRIVHFATHGIANERLPMSSGLVLTTPNRKGENIEDGFLQAWEIFERVRLDADLVVLSACDSGRGKELGGEGLLSLTRAFQFAGARAVVASLWQVSDKGSADLMIRFYRHLRNGEPAADALRQAQLEIVAQAVREQRTEYLAKDLVWAAFEVFGDWQ
ncbi:MAG TPA: CHAT domain-containing tetratricopeptide repeat protein [Thermoanaerobaculia bacterium]|nr:CHAT domain-containing tetratricopeptide repeat protein [Thermoanaerobaculia bacterium]